MAPEVPAEVDLVALGHTANAYMPGKRFTLSVNNAHAYYGFQTDLICAMDDLERDEVDHAQYVQSIVDAGVPVLTTGHREKWPATVAYPLADVLEWLDLPPFLGCKILTNTINYSIAYLAMKGAQSIHFWGVDFINPDSPGIVQRQQNFLDKQKWPDWTIYYMEALIRSPVEPGLDGCNWLMGLLKGRSINVGLPVSKIISTTLLDLDRPNFFYGYQDPPYDL